MGGRRGRVIVGVAAAVAAALGVPTLAIGSPEPELVVRLHASARIAPVGDPVSLRVVVERTGAEAGEAAVTLVPPSASVIVSDLSDPRCVPLPAGSAELGVPLERVECALGPLAPNGVDEAVVVVSPVRPGELEFEVEAPDGASAEATTVVTAQGEECDVVGTEGDDVLHATPEGSVVCGLGGNDVLHGGPGNDILIGGPGDDLLVGSAGNDALDGGDGRDTVSYQAAPRGIRADLAAGAALGWGVDGVQRVEDLVGSEHDDVLSGDAGTNRLEGRGGSDILRGGAGPDVLLGGAGADFLHGGPGADTLRGGPGDDICVAWGGGSRAGCQTRHPTDPRDTRGPLDVARVRTALGSRFPVWSMRTHRRWETRPLWDRGYVVVWLDTRGGPRPDHYALLRSTGRGVSGALYRVRSGRDARAGGLQTWRPNRRGISVRIPLDRLRIGPQRAFYRWGVQTVFAGPGCRRVCFDLVPGPERMFVQPLP